MSDGHGDTHAVADAHGGGHDAPAAAHGVADAHGGGGPINWWALWNTMHTDEWYDSVATYVSEQVSTFVAFIFFLITIGAIFGAMVAARNPAMEPILIILPAVLGLVAFYNRDIATLFFIVFIVAFIIL